MKKEMTKEKAIKIRSCFANGVDFKELETEETNILADALNDAIEKQISKKVFSPLTFGSIAICPSCCASQFNERNYCYNCGQKLDWEVENE